MTEVPSRPAASSTSLPRHSGPSHLSAEASPPSGSPGEGLGLAATRELTERFGIRPTKALGQNFLIDPNLALAISRTAGVGPHDRVLEIGAGFGSLTLALAGTGAEVTAMEFDAGLVPALREVTKGLENVRVMHDDATKADWSALLEGGEWVVCANLPYNVGTSIVMDLLDDAPRANRLVVMLQREVGERLAAGPGDGSYGAVSVKVAFHADARIDRAVPPEVFWPRPSVGSVVVVIDRHDRPPVQVDRDELFRVIDEAFAERRKTIRNGVRRLGFSSDQADVALERARVSASLRPEDLSLADFARLTEALRP
jgi:16S rRNA (adenine1518-N6/adenine1519-N6)-dimethyltransferase